MGCAQGLRTVSQIMQYIASRFPHYCCFCHSRSESNIDLCRFCHCCFPVLYAEKGFRFHRKLCMQCGHSLDIDFSDDKCAECGIFSSPYAHTLIPYSFDPPVDLLIKKLKYRSHLPSGRLLGLLLAGHVRRMLPSIDDWPEVLIPVPLHLRRRMERGFNHTEEIAFWCGRALDIPVKANLVSRVEETEALAGLSRAERIQTVTGVFQASEQLFNKRVAVVDDVLTTGATTQELARELLDTQVAQLQLWAVARTPLGSVAS